MKRKRELPVPGLVHVSKGDSVSPDTRIASASMASGTFTVRASQQLGIEPQELETACVVTPGQEVSEGAVLARHGGLFGIFPTEVKSPVAGIVEYISAMTGHIGIRLPPRELSLYAYLQGVVSEVIAERGIVIESSCVCVQGIFGIGGERTGFLKEIPIKREEVIRVTSFPDKIEGAVLFGGSGIGYGALKHAAEKGVRAIITGSIDDATLERFLGYQLGVAITGNEQVPLTLIVTEGFGSIPMNDKAFSVLKRHVGVIASVNGATQVRAGAVRPEVLIFHDDTINNAEQAAPALDVGTSVRLIRHPYFGRVGRVLELPQQLEKLDTGSCARIVRVILDSEETVTVPRANVEIL